MERQKTIGEMFRFAVVGVIAAALHYGTYFLLQLKINASIAFAIGYLVSFIFNYIFSARFTFKKRTSVKNGLGFCIAHGCNFIIQMSLLNLFLWIGINKSLAPLPVYCFAVPVNFLMVRFVFKKVGKS